MLAAVSDVLDRIRSELDDRLAALRPAADEFARLRRAADALDALDAAGGATRPAVSARAVRAPRAPARGGARGKPPRRRSSQARTGRAAPGQTQLRVIEQLRSNPGSSSTAVAQALGISANAAAATISRLVKQGRVRRLDTGGYAPPQPPADGPARGPEQSPPAESGSAES